MINYYSFKIFPCFWLAQTTCIIHRNKLLNQWRQKYSLLQTIEPMKSKWCQKCSPLQIIELLTEQAWGRDCVIFGEQKTTKSKTVKHL